MSDINGNIIYIILGVFESPVVISLMLRCFLKEYKISFYFYVEDFIKGLFFPLYSLYVSLEAVPAGIFTAILIFVGFNFLKSKFEKPF